jgi:hypothetical protein
MTARIQVSADGWSVRVKPLRQVRVTPEADDWDDVPSMVRQPFSVSDVRSLRVALHARTP